MREPRMGAARSNPIQPRNPFIDKKLHRDSAELATPASFAR